MPPKKRTASVAKSSLPSSTAKKAKHVQKTEEPAPTKQEEEKVTKNNIIAKLKNEAEKDKNAVRVYKPDKHAPIGYNVYKDYDCTLNQTNIGDNNNKFYIIQLLENAWGFYLWNRWGRVGEVGSNNGLQSFNQLDEAISAFEKKFKDKTANNWDERESFKPKSKKYTLIEMDSNQEEDEVKEENKTMEGVETRASKLAKETQELISMIFDKDMFNNALKTYDIDVKKMPLGKLSKNQIAKGFEVLEEIEDELKNPKKNSVKINVLSSKFYTVIPQDFGRKIPTSINSTEILQTKYDMLMVLSDIEMAQSMKEVKKEKNDDDEDSKLPNILDQNYEMLNCDLTLVDKYSNEFKIIKTYTEATKGYRQCEIVDVWKVERRGEEKRFAEHDGKQNRKLLWHGTSVAVVVAILKSGLRIMPHSGGRVGAGIYFASENGKSAGYTGTTNYKNKNVGIMFLNEVVLGKENHITKDDSSLKSPPSGYDSVIALGHTEPDPNADVELVLDEKSVKVPQGKPKARNISSSFSQSEYLIYKESQNRIRYLLKMNF